MTSEVMDWDSVYRGEGVFEGPPPWNIGEPQPELAALIAAGEVRSDVLDAGCGVAEIAMTLAARGYTVVGLDLSATAISVANDVAKQRGLDTASFQQADITSFTGYDERFNTIIDSTLFHSLPVEGRDGYLRSVHRAAAPGARFFALVFAKGAFPADAETKPNEVDADELRAAVGNHFEIDEVRSAHIHTIAPNASAEEAAKMPPRPFDDKGRMLMPAYLISAHKAG